MAQGKYEFRIGEQTVDQDRFDRIQGHFINENLVLFPLRGFVRDFEIKPPQFRDVFAGKVCEAFRISALTPSPRSYMTPKL